METDSSDINMFFECRAWFKEHHKEIIFMRPGDIAFYKSATFTGGVIRKLQKNYFNSKEWWTECNHAAPCIGSPSLIKDAVIPKVTIHSAYADKRRTLLAIARPNYINTSNEVLLNKFFFEQMKDLKDFGGEWYSEWQILGMLYYGLLGIAGVSLKRNPIRGGTICTEETFKFKLDMEKLCGVADPLTIKSIDPVVDTNKDVSSIWPAGLLYTYSVSKLYRIYRF